MDQAEVKTKFFFSNSRFKLFYFSVSEPEVVEDEKNDSSFLKEVGNQEKINNETPRSDDKTDAESSVTEENRGLLQWILLLPIFSWTSTFIPADDNNDGTSRELEKNNGKLLFKLLECINLHLNLPHFQNLGRT